MKILIYDNELYGKIDFLDKYKDILPIRVDEIDDKLKEHWKEIDVIIDTQSSHNFYKRCGIDEEKLFSKNVKFVIFKGRKIIKLFSLKNFFYKEDNFDEEDFKKIKCKRNIISKTLDSLSETYSNNLQKELEEIANKTFNLKHITPDHSEVIFVKDKKDDDRENVIDVNSLCLLKDLKDILVNKI